MEYARSFKPHKFIKPFRFLICSRKLKEFFKYSLKSNLTILLIILAISGCDFKDQHLKVENGFMDLSVWSFKKDGVVKLNGEWEFYWKQFKSPEDTFTNNQAKYLNIPGGWKDHAFYGENLEGYGYGTYRLVLHANSELEFAGLRVPPISTAYKLWINGKSYSHFGRVGKNQEEYNSQYCPNITYFTVDKPEIEILIQVANFMHTNGGIKQPLILGTANQIKNIRDNNLAKELFVFSCLFILSILQIDS